MILVSSADVQDKPGTSGASSPALTIYNKGFGVVQETLKLNLGLFDTFAESAFDHRAQQNDRQIGVGT